MSCRKFGSLFLVINHLLTIEMSVANFIEGKKKNKGKGTQLRIILLRKSDLFYFKLKFEKILKNRIKIGFINACQSIIEDKTV